MQLAAGLVYRNFSADFPRSIIMKPISIVGLVLIIAGIVGLALGHFSFTTEKKIIDVGPITATTEEHHSIPIPDIAGVAAVVAGAVLLVVGQRRA
jgi:uncharacterized membrane protein YidH (DUF202 family)